MFISYSGKYTDDKISYNTEKLINLFHKYNIKFNRKVWTDFVEVCKTQKAFKISLIQIYYIKT